MNQIDFSRLIWRYVVGFVAALVLSAAAYSVVVFEIFVDSYATMAVILALAIVQLIVQLIFFLHLDIKGRSLGRTISLAFTIVMMLIIVIGSIWIMRNLDYRMNMSSEAMNEYMQKQNKKGF